MDMVPYVVRQGDHLQQLAYERGFDAMTVWNDAKNDALRKARPDPNILAPGDVLYIPAQPAWHDLAVGSTTTFTSPRAPDLDMSVAFTQAGKPIANAKCVVHGLPPPASPLQTDGDGKLQLTVPVDVRVLYVEFPDTKLVVTLNVGALDPTSEPSGVWERLRNLGHVDPSAPPLGYTNDEELAEAVRAFQNAQGLPVTGQLDDATRAKLETAHGC